MNENQYKQVDKYIVTKNLLGRGSFGDVYRGFLKSDHSQLTAVKVIPIEKISSDPKFLKLLKREIDIMQQIQHTNIVRMYGASKTHTNLYMFLEYCKDGDLKQLLRHNSGRFSETQAVQYLVMIVAGFGALYSQNVIHRDIKPANILVHDNLVKITDFGFARHLAGRHSHQSNRSAHSTHSVATGLVNMEELRVLSNVGTPLYMCPQILNNQKFSSKCDIWSLGMMFYEMLYGRTPWMASSPFQLYQNIRKLKLEFDLRPQRSEVSKGLLRKMLVIDDRHRISWPEVFNHELFCQDQLRPINHALKDESQKSEFQSLLNESPQKTHPQFYTQDGDEPTLEKQLDRVVQQQDRLLHRTKVIDSFIRYFSFQRNVAVFLNYATTLFFNLFNQKKWGRLVERHLFEKTFFLLQRQQINLYQKLISTLEKHRVTKLFSQGDWQIFYSSVEYDECLQKIKNDRDFMLPYYEQVQKNTYALFKRLKASDPARHQQMVDIEVFLSEDLVKNERVFTECYQKNIGGWVEEQRRRLAGNEFQQSENRQVLLVLRFIQLAVALEFTFINQPKKCFDFDKFYEKYEYIKTEELVMEINTYVSK